MEDCIKLPPKNLQITEDLRDNEINEPVMTTEIEKLKEMLKELDGDTLNFEEMSTSLPYLFVIRVSTKCRFDDPIVLPSFHLFIAIDDSFWKLKVVTYNCSMVEQKVIKTEKVSFQIVKDYVERFLGQLYLCPGISEECETGKLSYNCFKMFV